MEGLHAYRKEGKVLQCDEFSQNEHTWVTTISMQKQNILNIPEVPPCVPFQALENPPKNYDPNF